MTVIHHITFKREVLREQHIRDAQNADDWPEDELHEVLLDPDEITVEGTPEGIRWLYDILHQFKRDWRQEGEQWDADVAEDMAETIWTAVDGELPDQQRPRRLSDGGQSGDPLDQWMVSAVEGIQCEAPRCDAYPVAERNGRNLCAKHRRHHDHSTFGEKCERCESRHWVKTPDAASHAVCAICDLVVYDEEITEQQTERNNT